MTSQVGVLGAESYLILTIVKPVRDQCHPRAMLEGTLITGKSDQSAGLVEGCSRNKGQPQALLLGRGGVGAVVLERVSAAG